MVGGLRIGFLEGQELPQPKAYAATKGASKKRKNEEPSAGTSPKKQKMPHSGPCLVIDMILLQGNIQHPIKVLLDTGCSIALINQRMIPRLRISKQKHTHSCGIENFTGEKVPGAGQIYTKPLLIRHRKYYSREKFEISPMEPGIDVFLPFSWIMSQQPQGAWTTAEIRLNSASCLENCINHETNEFSLTWDDSVATNPGAQVVGYMSATSEKEDLLKNIPREFRQFLGIMDQEAAEALPEHRPYDCKIELQDGRTPPWGPIYPLLEVKLQTL